MTSAKSKLKNTNELDRNIGAKITEVRLSLGITRQNLASQLGVTHQQLQKYEHGINRISIGRLFDISTALNVSINLFTEAAKVRHNIGLDNSNQRMCVKMMKDFLTIKRRDQQEAVKKLIHILATED